MELIRIYKCLCDETRLRILHLLSHSPLCVCHLQSILGKSQVVMSQHLAYLRKNGLVEARRHQTWIIYDLPLHRSPELEMNLKCLQDCVTTTASFRRDLAQIKKIQMPDCKPSSYRMKIKLKTPTNKNP
jgi:ArsR family transcriptional regulator, arsenate/arsenite/antimonite-responsive transcriptional repressor